MKKHQILLGSALVVVASVAFADSPRGRGTQVQAPASSAALGTTNASKIIKLAPKPLKEKKSGKVGGIRSALDPILYNQSLNGSYGFTSQNFEAVYDAYDSFMSDDFNVTGSHWVITAVAADGFTTAGINPLTVNVNFYANVTIAGIDHPDDTQVLCSYTAVAATAGGTFGSTLTATLCPACELDCGHFWVSVQANQDFLPTFDQWFWIAHVPSIPAEDNFKNPGGGFGTPCSTWGQTCTQCGICAGPTFGAQDMAYTLYGTTCGTCGGSSCGAGGNCGGGGGGGNCDLTAIEAKLDALEGKADASATAIAAIEGKADAAATATAAIEGKADSLEAKADVADDPCVLVNLLCPLIKGCKVDSTSPCFVP